MPSSENQRRRLYWPGLVLTGLIPLVIAILLVVGTIKIYVTEFAHFQQSEHFILVGVNIYVAFVIAIGHYWVYSKLYKHSGIAPMKYQNFGSVFGSWLTGNSYWHIIGLVVLPLTTMLIFAMFGYEGFDFTGTNSKFSDLEEKALSVGLFVLMSFAAIVAMIVYVVFFAFVVFACFSVPLSLISSVLFRLYSKWI